MKLLTKIILVATIVAAPNIALAETIWEDYSIELKSGKTIYAVLERNQDCFNLLVGSSNTSIRGNASNCSDDLKNSVWAIYACGNRETLSYHGPWDAIKEIVRMCN